MALFKSNQAGLTSGLNSGKAFRGGSSGAMMGSQALPSPDALSILMRPRRKGYKRTNPVAATRAPKMPRKPRVSEVSSRMPGAGSPM